MKTKKTKTETAPLPAILQRLPVRDAGTYLIVTECGCWGRGPTIAEAYAKACAAGARHPTWTHGRFTVRWQADADWQAHAAEHGAECHGRKVGPMLLSTDGVLYYWGAKAPDRLYVAGGGA